MIKKTRVPAAFAAGVVSLLVTGAAFAHHPEIEAEAVCVPNSADVVINYVSTAWSSGGSAGGRRENPQIDIAFDGVVVDSGAYVAPDYSFSGSEPAPAGSQPGDMVVVSATAIGTWGDGADPTQDPTRETIVTIPDNCVPPEPGIALRKEVSVDGGATYHDANDAGSAPATTVGGGALYRLIVENIGDVDLSNVIVNDPTLGIVDYLLGDLAVGAEVILTEGSIPELNAPNVCDVPGVVENVAFVDGEDPFGTPVMDEDPANVQCDEPPGGGQGCTPGYWKQSHHFDSWNIYDPSDDYEGVFGVDASFTKTLLGALKQGGGGEKALGRHATAALLNAASPDVSYAFTISEIIDLVQDAYASGDFEPLKDVLDEENNQGCPLN